MPRLTQKPLTQRIVDATPIPATASTVLRDPVERGLTLRVWPSGKKTWSFEYRSPISGKNSRLGLPPGTLAEARQLARGHRATLAFGRDPSLEAKQDLAVRRGAHAKAISVTTALDLYAASRTASAKQTSWRKRMRGLRRALTGLTDRQVASLTRADLILQLDRIQASSGGVSRNRGQGEIRSFLEWCRQRDLVESNVLDRVRKSVRENPRERVLSDDELRTLIRMTPDRSPFSDVTKVLLHSAMRRSEAASLQAGDLDFEQKTITVRAEIAKTNRSRVIPMCAAITGLLRERTKGLESDQHIFGDGSGFARPFADFAGGIKRLRVATSTGTSEDGGWTLHDIRRTVATRMHEAGGDALVIEDLLGHVSGVRRGVAGVYNRAKTLERQRQALELWSVTLQAIATK